MSLIRFRGHLPRSPRSRKTADLSRQLFFLRTAHGRVRSGRKRGASAAGAGDCSVCLAGAEEERHQRVATAMDRISRERRSWNMSRIRGRDTKPEVTVRSVLHRLGFRFRLHRKDLPGRPDIVLARHRNVILVHGCFWHRHSRCRFAYNPKSNTTFWKQKFAANVLRDKRDRRRLRGLAWRVIVVWECQAVDRAALATRLGAALRSRA